MNFFSRFFGPPSRDAFAAIVLKCLRQVGDDRVGVYDKAESRLVFTRDGKEAGSMSLPNLHLEYCNLPRNMRNKWLRQVMVGMANPMEIPEDFEDVKPDLYPSVRTRSTLAFMALDAELRGEGALDVPVLPLSDHLETILVYDLPSTVQFVAADHLEKWGVTLYEAYEVALQNLKEKPANVGVAKNKDDRELLYLISNGDSFDATRMLDLAKISRMTFSGLPVALPITRDCLMITGSEDEEGLALMLAYATQDQSSPRPISRFLHILMDDDWQTWSPPETSPSFEGFRMLSLGERYGDYEEQKRLLDLLHEKQDVDVFAATFMTREHEGKTVSFGVWTENMPIWLPETEYIGFLTREKDLVGFVPWDRARKVLGSKMECLPYHPPRWLVNGFPSEQEFAELKPEVWPNSTN
ncbi:MAG: DUF1444 family protein [Planctomycetales bacterium]